MSSPLPLEQLIDQFRKLPSIGQKSATRLAYYVLSMSKEEADEFANAIIEAKRCITRCSVCQNLSAGDICSLCTDETRESVICVVEDPKAVNAIESTREFKGGYHVLHGVMNPKPDIPICNKIHDLKKNGMIPKMSITTRETI